MSESSLVWRVNRKPRFPLLSFGEYMALADGPRETMRRAMKYERIAPTLLHTKLQRAVASFLASPIRDKRILDRCRNELEAARASAPTPRAEMNAAAIIRALDVFERSLNALPVSGVRTQLVSPSKPRIIEGVKVSIQPTVMITVARSRGKALKGAVVVDVARGQEPVSPEAKTRATEGMKHASYLLHEHVAELVGENEKSSPEHCMIFHSHRPELVTCPTNYKKPLRNIEAACRDIASRWDDIEPPASFDASRARFRD